MRSKVPEVTKHRQLEPLVVPYIVLEELASGKSSSKNKALLGGDFGSILQNFFIIVRSIFEIVF